MCHVHSYTKNIKVYKHFKFNSLNSFRNNSLPTDPTGFFLKH